MIFWSAPLFAQRRRQPAQDTDTQAAESRAPECMACVSCAPQVAPAPAPAPLPDSSEPYCQGVRAGRIAGFVWGLLSGSAATALAILAGFRHWA